MEWLILLADIFEVCIIPLLGVLTAYLVAFIRSKSKELAIKSENELAQKYITMLGETISACVIATNQTYVENLKKEQIFDAEAQKEAFQKTYDAVMAVLTEEAKIYLANAYGDLNTYITNKIEAEVKLNK